MESSRSLLINKLVLGVIFALVSKLKCTEREKETSLSVGYGKYQSTGFVRH